MTWATRALQRISVPKLRAALAIASLIFALQHGYALELAVRTGLHDLRQAVLAGCASLLLALAVYGLRRLA